MDIRLFSGKNSPDGRAKQEFLRRNRVILPRFPGADPYWRVSWEAFVYYILTTRDAVIAELRKCTDGTADTAVRFEQLPVESPLERFQNWMFGWFFPRVKEQLNPEWAKLYLPEHGFDLDVFWLANDPAHILINCEVFPRLGGRKQSEAFVSGISFRNVLLDKLVATVPSRFGDIPEVVLTLITAERRRKGEKLLKVAKDWGQFRGCWSVEEEMGISLLLNWTMTAIVDTGHESMAMPQFAKGGLNFAQTSQGTIHFR